jgi:hypothetical protein
VLCSASVATLDDLLRSVFYKAASSLSYTSYFFLFFFLGFFPLIFGTVCAVCLSVFHDSSISRLLCFTISVGHSSQLEQEEEERPGGGGVAAAVAAGK